MNPKKYQDLAGLTKIFHISVILSMIIAMFSIFFYEPLRLYSAIWLATIWMLNQICGDCPLTIEEYKLRRLSGERVKRKRFIARFFKKYFDLNIPKWITRGVLTLYFFISAFVIILYFF